MIDRVKEQVIEAQCSIYSKDQFNRFLAHRPIVELDATLDRSIARGFYIPSQTGMTGQSTVDGMIYTILQRARNSPPYEFRYVVLLKDSFSLWLQFPACSMESDTLSLGPMEIPKLVDDILRSKYLMLYVH